MGMAITLDDLAGDGGDTQPHLFTDKFFDMRWNGRMCTDRAGYFADCDLFKCRREPLLSPPQFIDPERQFQAKCRWFRVDTMCASRYYCIFILNGRLCYRVNQLGQRGAQKYSCLFQLGRQRSVEHI